MAVLGSIPARAGLGVEGEASGSFLAGRRSCREPWPGLGCTGAAGPRWSTGAARWSERAVALRASVAARVGAEGFWGILFVGRRSTLGVRARRESLTGDLEWPVRVGGEGRRERKELTCGPWLAEGEREGGGARHLARAKLGRALRGRWAAGIGGRGERARAAGPGWGEKREGRNGLLGWAAFSYSLFLFFSKLTQINLNSHGI
jgi:hypothetical protein